MFIGGSPGSTAGGIKTVTLAVVVVTALAALRKRQEVEMFRRSVRIVVVGRAITVTLLFVAVLFTAALTLSITENASQFAMSDIFFEAASALGTVGLTTGITPSLTTAGKLIIIAVMLIGRLGPLTLLAALTFNLKPARYNYPDEAIIVG
jgi:trk system potassium uptake protein TrkH